MKVKIEEGCIGCGLCESTCPNVFELSSEGLSQVISQPQNEDDENGSKEAAMSCPVSVIKISE